MRYKKITELEGGVIILADPLNWILQVGNADNRSYFPTLDDLCDEFFDLRLKLGALKATALKKSLKELAELVRDAREEAREDIEKMKQYRQCPTEAVEAPPRQ